MAALADKLSFLEFQERYEHGERSYEYWYGEPVPEGESTSIHGFLQIVIAKLLGRSGLQYRRRSGTADRFRRT